MSNNTKTSKIIAKTTNSAKNAGDKIAAINSIKNGKTGGERLAGIMNLISGSTQSTE